MSEHDAYLSIGLVVMTLAGYVLGFLSCWLKMKGKM